MGLQGLTLSEALAVISLQEGNNNNIHSAGLIPSLQGFSYRADIVTVCLTKFLS